jgi:hypothetical protein
VIRDPLPATPDPDAFDPVLCSSSCGDAVVVVGKAVCGAVVSDRGEHGVLSFHWGHVVVSGVEEGIANFHFVPRVDDGSTCPSWHGHGFFDCDFGVASVVFFHGVSIVDCYDGVPGPSLPRQRNTLERVPQNAL